MTSFEELEHTADRAFRVTGRDLADLLENAACAMQALDGVGASVVGPSAEPSATREIEVQGIDRESLLVNWLNEILFLEQTQQLVCERFHIHELNDDHLRARVETRDCNESHTHIKAATFHNLEIRQTSEGLEVEIVLDV
jgi:SHS2 domain-containing protein